MDISEKWDSLTISEKLEILSINYPFDFLLHRQAFLDFCNLKFDELYDVQYRIIKNVITNHFVNNNRGL